MNPGYLKGVREERARCLAAVDAEEEFPDVPAPLRAVQELVREAINLTKANIRERINGNI